LLLNAPSHEEAHLLRKAQCEETVDELNAWDAAEEFALALLAVPRFQLRLQVWDFENSFQEVSDLLYGTVRDMQRGLTCLRASPRLRHLLGLTLFAGNHLNGGTSRGRADGFSIDGLAQARTVKMSRGERQGTLVDFLVQQMEKQYPGELAEAFEPQCGEGEMVLAAARRRLDDARLELTRTRCRCCQMLQALQAVVVQKSGQCDDPVLLQHREILSIANAELEQLQVQYARLDETYDATCGWFHLQSSARKTVDDFLLAWSAFLHDVDRSRRALQQQEQQQIIRQRRLERSASRGLSPQSDSMGRGPSRERWYHEHEGRPDSNARARTPRRQRPEINNCGRVVGSISNTN